MFIPPPENRVVYGIMWKDIVEQSRPRMATWSMSIACWITRPTNAHSEYVIFIAFLLQQRLYERASKLRYTYIACLVYSMTFVTGTWVSTTPFIRMFLFRSYYMDFQ
jgi:hypothetical protein